MAELSPISVSTVGNPIHISSSLPILSFQSFNISCTNTTRRLGLGLVALIASSVATTPVEMAANALDLKLIAPEESLEEAESGIRNHAESLLLVRGLIESESWKEAQRRLRSSSSLMKQDLYIIIESKPPAERPAIRKLYSVLFNSVTRMDYAARDRDVERVWQCYDNIVMAVSQILSRIYK